MFKEISASCVLYLVPCISKLQQQQQQQQQQKQQQQQQQQHWLYCDGFRNEQV